MPIRNASVRLVQRGPDKPYRTSLQWQARRRAADLTRIYRDQFPNGLPHNSLGVKCARYLCRTMAFDPIDCRAQWLDRYASWIDADTRSKILSLGPHWYSASSLGQHLELYDEDRERLQAWTIEACNVTKDERKVINKGKNRKAQERHRRKNGSVSREEYLAKLKSQPKMWELLGMSRPAYYRLDPETRSVMAHSILNRDDGPRLTDNSQGKSRSHPAAIPLPYRAIDRKNHGDGAAVFIAGKDDTACQVPSPNTVLRKAA
jgi:hypothetical protein